MISLDCPSTITRRSAVDGNHMPAGLTSPSQSLSKGREDEEERREEESGGTKQERREVKNREVRGVQRDGGGVRGEEGEVETSNVSH